jgi:hypothetical protein
LDDELKKSQKLKSLIDFYESNEPTLLGEIDRVAAIYTKLEEQQSKGIFDLTKFTEQAMRLKADITKCGQKFSHLESTNEGSLSSTTASRMTRDKRQGLVEHLEKKEKSLETQVVS